MCFCCTQGESSLTVHTAIIHIKSRAIFHNVFPEWCRCLETQQWHKTVLAFTIHTFGRRQAAMSRINTRCHQDGPRSQCSTHTSSTIHNETDIFLGFTYVCVCVCPVTQLGLWSFMRTFVQFLSLVRWPLWLQILLQGYCRALFGATSEGDHCWGSCNF